MYFQMVYENMIQFNLRIQHTNSKSSFNLKDFALPSPTKPQSTSPASSPEPASPPSLLLNGKMDIGSQGSSLSTAAALSKITNFSIAAIINQQQNQQKLRALDVKENEDDVRIKRRRLEDNVPKIGRL